jgi:transcriptional regulator with XRE-family HTH domain
MAQPAPSALGRFIREQRQLAHLSLREMARLASVSNAYLSQVERGLHEPSIRVLNALADVLEVPIEDLVVRDQMRSTRSTGVRATVESSIRTDDQLTVEQKEALLAVYRSYMGKAGGGET